MEKYAGEHPAKSGVLARLGYNAVNDVGARRSENILQWSGGDEKQEIRIVMHRCGQRHQSHPAIWIVTCKMESFDCVGMCVEKGFLRLPVGMIIFVIYFDRVLEAG